MSLKQKLLDKIKNPRLKSAMESTPIRARVFFVLSILVSLAFVAFNAAAGILYQSIWYGSLAVYYIMLVLQKILLVVFGGVVHKKYSHNQAKYLHERWRVYLGNGIYLLVLDLALIAAIVQMATTENPAHAGMITAIATAAFAFFKITTAIIDAVKTRKTDDVLLQVIRNINLVAATVSMLALTSTMISTFGNFEEMHPLLSAISAGIGLIIIVLGVYMIAHAAKKLKELQPAADVDVAMQGD